MNDLQAKVLLGPKDVRGTASEPPRPTSWAGGSQCEPGPDPGVSSDEQRPEKVKRRRPPIAIFALLLVVAAGILVTKRLAQPHALPEGLIQVNGRMEGDRVTLASKFSGRIGRLLAREGDPVTKGQVVVQVDDPQTRARLQQAKANLEGAIAQASGARESVSLTAETTDAQVLQAQGLVNQAESGIASANADAARAAAAVTTAKAVASSAAANVTTARAAYDAAVANRQRAAAAVSTAQAQVESAQAAVRATQAAVEAAQAADDKASSDARRFRALVAEAAVSEQTGDLYVAAEKTARAQLASARQQVAAAEAGVAARQSDVNAARQQLEAEGAAIQEAKAQVAGAREQAAAARAGVRQAEAQYRAAQQMVDQAEAKRQQAIGQLNQARTAPRQVAVSRTNRSQAWARIRQTRAAVEELQSTLQDLSIVAPVSGTITTRLRDVGEVVAAGSPVLDLVDLDRLYLKVYVPENQIGKLRLGLAARIYVDALPEEYFAATVRYIASTAEFTPKEVQTPDERVKLVYAVKLYLTSNPQHQLTPGMPADAMIRWKDDVAWQKPRW